MVEMTNTMRLCWATLEGRPGQSFAPNMGGHCEGIELAMPRFPRF